MNPTRTGFLGVLERMGARVAIEGVTEHFGEPVADLVVGPAGSAAPKSRRGKFPASSTRSRCSPSSHPGPAGSPTFRGVGELRVKESDRLSLIAENLRAVGGRAEVQGDDLIVEGVSSPPGGQGALRGRPSHGHGLRRARHRRRREDPGG